jgi:uncharacterized protein (DUF305 family)
VIIELLVMKGMYENAKFNAIIIAASAAAPTLFFGLIRYQTAISDQQFLRSMIPHHAGAILMCEQAPIRDPKIEQLCASIVKGQNDEIAQMKLLLQAR